MEINAQIEAPRDGEIIYSTPLISSLQDHIRPKLVLVLPELVWLRRIRRVLFHNDFF